jgi:hypothetical protein
MVNAAVSAASISFILASSALGTLGLSLVVGQAARLSLPGQGGGLLVSDIAASMVLVIAVIQVLRQRTLSPLAWRVGLICTPFIIWSAGTLLMHAPLWEGGALLVTLAYWVRLSVYLLLLPALLSLCAQAQLRRWLGRVSVLVVTLLALLGFAQLWWLPNLALVGNGWDPHSGRLVSTWLDPNFAGVFFALALVPLAARFLAGGRVRGQGAAAAALLLAASALLLTQSRSALVALMVAAALSFFLITLRSLRRPQAAWVVVTICGLSVILLSLFLASLGWGERLWGVIVLDATAELRRVSWAQAWALVEEHGWLGVGYNAYQFAAAAAGQSENFMIHSRAGADSSWLTLWVTTGLPGLALWCLPWLVLGVVLLRRWIIWGQAAAWAGIISLSVLFVHAQFVNSFLYVHLLCALIVVLVLALTQVPKTTSA